MSNSWHQRPGHPFFRPHFGGGDFPSIFQFARNESPLTANQPARSLFSKCCDDFITTSLPQNGKTQSNARDGRGGEAKDQPPQKERIAYSIHEAADMLGVDYFSVYRLIQRGKLKACRALRGKLDRKSTRLN